MRIDFTNAVVEDDGYGVEVNGRSLEAIISTALGTRLGDKGGYSSGLPRFKANNNYGRCKHKHSYTDTGAG